MIAGIFYLVRTECQWEALPLSFCARKTVYHCFTQLVKLGAFQIIWKSILMLYDRTTGLKLQNQSVDSQHKKASFGGDKAGKSPVDKRK